MGLVSSSSPTASIQELETSIIYWEAYSRMHPDEADSCNHTIDNIRKKIKQIELQRMTGSLASTLQKSSGGGRWFSGGNSSQHHFYQNIETINDNLTTHTKLESASIEKKTSPRNKKIYNDVN